MAVAGARRPERGQAGKRQVHFGEHSARTIVSDAGGEVRLKMGGPEQAEERSSRVGSGDDSASRNFLAAGERDAAGGGIPNADGCNFSTGSNFRARLCRG